MKKLKDCEYGSLGSEDKKHKKRADRRKKRTQLEQISPHASTSHSSKAVVQDAEYSADTSSSGDDSSSTAKKQIMHSKRRPDLLSPSVCAVADKHKISHRALTELIGKIHKKQ